MSSDQGKSSFAGRFSRSDVEAYARYLWALFILSLGAFLWLLV